MTHPFLYFSRKNVEDLRRKMCDDAALKALYDAAVANVEECLTAALITEDEANGRNTESQHAGFGELNRQANKFCRSLGTKYLFDGDMRCAEKLKELLFHYITFERWYGVSYAVRKPVAWHSDLCSTATTLALACVYDIIYDVLTEDERRSAADGILRLGVYPALGDWVLPEMRIHALESMGHNWWAVCIGEVAVAFLAVSEFLPSEERTRVLALTDSALAEYLRYSGNTLFNKTRNFDDMGLFYESIGYGNYGTGTLLRYLFCSERYFGKNETVRSALPEGLCDAALKLSYPCTRNGKLFFEFACFGDHSPGGNIEFFIKYCVLLGIASPAAYACLDTYSIDLWDVLSGLSPEKTGCSVSDLPKTVLFSSGYAVTRNSWNSDATMFAVKSGYCWNHSHNDSGTFVIWHKGKTLFTDSGTCSYEDPLYHAYYCQDDAHSVIRIGGEGQRHEELFRGTKFPGRLSDSFSTDGLFFVQADVTGPMAHLCSRLYRNFIWLDNRLLVIFDDVLCHRENTVEFTLHFDGEYSAAAGRIDFVSNACSARLLTHMPESMELTERIGHTDHKQDADVPYIELKTAGKQRTHLLINTLELDPEENNTVFTRLNGENSCGLRISCGDTEWELLYNRLADGHVMHDNSVNTVAGFDTDAYMLVITRDRNSGSERVLMICGSFLRRDGKTYISSFTKKTEEVEL